MLLKRLVIKDKEGKDDIVEAIYDSTNLLKTTYLIEQRRLYVYFRKGIVYSYYAVDREMYDGLETAQSQGVYHKEHLSNNRMYPYAREFKMLNFEIQDINEEIEKAKKLLNENRTPE